MRKLRLVLLVLGIGLPGAAWAAPLLIEENFTYPIGVLLNANGWTNHSGTMNFIPVTASGLSYPGYPSSGIGNAASMLTTGEDVNRTYANQTSGSVYYAFMANVSAAQMTGDYFTHLGTNAWSTTFPGRVFCRAATGGVNFGVSRSGTGTSVAWSSNVYALNTTHLLVLKYTFVAGVANDLVDLFVDPSSCPGEPLPTVSAGVEAGSEPSTGVGGVALRQGSAALAPTLWIDGLRVGTTWVDVVCGATGACCAPGGDCSVQTQANCLAASGTYQGDSSICLPNPCPQSGTCCGPDGTCTFVLQADCAGVWTQGGTCSPSPCPQPDGSCCALDGSCTVTLQVNCTGTWAMFGSCTPNICPQPTGSCFGWNNDGQSTCVMGVTEAQCQAQGAWQNRRFIPGGTVSDIGLPVSLEPDTGDIDGDPATLTIRWRYVVMVDDCRIVGDECQERHRLLRCWKDDDHNCTNIQELVNGQWVSDTGASAKWVTVFTGCTEDCGCEAVDQANYAANGGCDRTNFHYVMRCVRRMPGFSAWASNTDPAGMSPPGGPFFQSGPTGIPFPADIGGRIWISRRNLAVPDREKTWTVEISGPDADRFGVQVAHGYIQGAQGPAQEVPIAVTTGIKDNPGPPRKRTFTFLLRPQPAWEVVELVRTGAFGILRSGNMIVNSYSQCVAIAALGHGMTLDGQFGVPTESTPRITQVLTFPLNVPVNPEGLNTFVAPPHSGGWTPSAVFVDPDGHPRPYGGMQWVTDGFGLLPTDEFSLRLDMTGPADSDYDMYAYDIESGEYQFFDLVLEDPMSAPEPSVSNRGGLSVQAFPSPFSLSTRVAYRVLSRGHVSLKVYNVRGELIRTLIDEVMDSGTGDVVWDGTSDAGEIVASGVYVYRAHASGAVASGTIVLVK